MIVNCDFCGRDTPNKSRICKTCKSGVSKHLHKDRPNIVRFAGHWDAEVIAGENRDCSRDAEIDDEVHIAMLDMLE